MCDIEYIKTDKMKFDVRLISFEIYIAFSYFKLCIIAFLMSI